ncbi:MAG: hypothetical protein SZ59_C0002G0208 [candidate division TM6 bacterium GW2011_GWF2_28_16]|nr:MAG: hypothetical protein SZ59_C0002G0208 [candidate division TM6 bacterium GW2011_GWF2_28_16]
MYKNFIKNIFLLFILSTSLNAQTVQELLQSNYSIRFDQLLGRGGSGTVFGSSDNCNIAIKSGESSRQCEIITKEFNIQQDIYSAIEKYNKELFNRILVLKPNKLIYTAKDICAMEMPRLYPIKEELNKNLITQLKTGEQDLDQIEQTEDKDIVSGHSIGLVQITDIINKYSKINANKTNLEQLYEDLGTFLGILHYKVKLDGLDLEICLIRENDLAENYKLAFLDFGLCNNIFYNSKKNKNLAKENIIKAMLVDKRYPNPTEPYFKNFKKEYIAVAKSANLKSFAQDIIKTFIKEQFFKKIIIPEYLKTKLNINGKKAIQINGYSNIICNWTEIDLFKFIKQNKYNVSIEQTIDYLDKILHEIALTKKNDKKLTNTEKSIILKLEK